MKTRNIMNALLCVAALSPVLLAECSLAEVKLPAVLGSHMVLQRDRPVPIWGTAEPGEKITVRFREQEKSATADAAGEWMVRLDPLNAGGPDTMQVAGTHTLSLEDVLVGEVWVGSGQSNMGLPVSQARDADASINCQGDPVLAEAASHTYPRLRLFIHGNRWLEATPEHIAPFSALLFSFGVPLQEELDVPVGLMESAQGATASRHWLSQEAFDADPACRAGVEAMTATRGADKLLPGQAWGTIRVGGLYESRIRPMIPFAIRGVLWDQGEAGTDMAGVDQYTLMGALIRGWRKDWGQGDFPFLYVQKPSGPGCAWDYDDPVTRLARPFVPVPGSAPGNAAGAYVGNHIRIMRYPNTAMVISSDLGPKNHPDNKSGYGSRAARVALGFVYGREIGYYGPVYASHQIEGDKVRVHFTHIGKGLAWRHGENLQGFALAGEDKIFHWADAVIEGETVVLSCNQVKHPVAVCYGWGHEYPWANLFNQDRLPAMPFLIEVNGPPTAGSENR